MTEPGWYSRLPRAARKVLDQVLHALAGAGISGLAGGVASIWLEGWLAGLIGALVGSAAGGIREAVQNLGDRANDTLGNWLDFAVWAGASVAIGLVIWGVGA